MSNFCPLQWTTLYFNGTRGLSNNKKSQVTENETVEPMVERVMAHKNRNRDVT